MQLDFFPHEKGDEYSDGPMWNYSDFRADNRSNVSVSHHAHSAYHWEVLVLLPIMLFGMTGNILVCMAVSMEKRLQSVTNYFLLSLAITDLFVSILVMPFSIIHQFFGYWPFNYILCDFYVTCDVLMCTSSILHLCTISLERYLAISSPLSLRNKSKVIVMLKIALVWAFSLAITSPITILGIVDHRNILNNHECALTNRDFIIYGSTGAFFIPLGIMVITYGLTIRLLHKQSKMCGLGKDKEGQPIIRRSISRRAMKFHRRVPFSSPRRTNSCPSKSCPLHGNQVRSASVRSCQSSPVHELSNMDVTPPSSPAFSTKGGSTLDMETIAEENHNGIGWRTSSISSTTCSMSSNESPVRLKNLVKRHQLVLKATGILLQRRDNQNQLQSSPKHDQNDVNTEQKASKVLGMVFVIFIVCWAPFFVVNILTVLCTSCSFNPLLFTVFVWLGYVSSTLNPIIYTTFNKTFKMTFIKLLKCQYRTIQKSLRVRWHSRNGFQSTFKSNVYYGTDDKTESHL